MTKGHDLTWQRVSALVAAGQWQNTVFILTWDDWGGYAELPPFRVPRVDGSRSLAGRIDAKVKRPARPSLGSKIVQPAAPRPQPPRVPPQPWGGPNAQPLAVLIANRGASIPAPDDAIVRPTPPRKPAGL